MRNNICLITKSLLLSLLIYNPLFAEQPMNATESIPQTPKSISDLELAGSDSFDYDINNKLRKAKSNFTIGIGGNVSKINHESLGNYKVNVSVLLGYSQFIHKTFGFRMYGIFDYNVEKLYGAAGFDILWDFLQTEYFGLGLIAGSSVGYSKITALDGRDGVLSQFHAGVSMNFDSGKSRLEGLVRLPYHKLKTNDLSIDVGITYVIMYSYLF
ncbi:hypothetical protein CQA66_07670 [Helicobacter aurati]|uniref:Outer membrane beta-barrel protein n=1 Tax=Helicobacter aurati TaxID=137778 RepID=A0A3D8IZN4_9HELI|nr:hypothetical protein [Helicobacter aurati]RDU70708.1 hypothetical protein CQA66_07670 [Helicobacter aurati]